MSASPEHFENAARANIIAATVFVIIASFTDDFNGEMFLSVASLMFVIAAYINTYLVYLNGGYDPTKIKKLFDFSDDIKK